MIILSRDVVFIQMNAYDLFHFTILSAKQKSILIARY